jgi:protein-disulfide isomerase
MSGKKDDRRSAARLVREQLAAEQRRKRMIWTGTIAGVVAVVAGMIVWALVQSNKTAAINTPATSNTSGNAIVTGSGPVMVDEYVDFMCPHCKTFHEDTGAALKQLADAGQITLVSHPVAYLDRFSSGTKYSTRASAASACAADGGKFSEFTGALFAQQPPEGSPGLTDEQLIQAGRTIGLDETFAQCVRDDKYTTWVKKVSDDATEAGVTGTPTIFVNGKQVQGTAAILAAIDEASTGASPSPSAG